MGGGGCETRHVALCPPGRGKAAAAGRRDLKRGIWVTLVPIPDQDIKTTEALGMSLDTQREPKGKVEMAALWIGIQTISNTRY